MNQKILDDIRACLDKKDIPIHGIADAAELNRTAPAGFRPEDMLPGACAVMIVARPLPLSIFQTPRNHKLYSFYTSAFHTYYQSTNEAVNAFYRRQGWKVQSSFTTPEERKMLRYVYDF